VSVLNRGLGIAVKVVDGSSRALGAITLEVLRQLGLVTDEDIHGEALKNQYQPPVKNIMHISVMGELDSKADVDRLLESIDENCDCEIHLTFLDANVVPREIVEKIVKLKEHNKCKIFVLKAYLYSYFLSLGISCFLVKKKSILNKDFESKEN